MDVFVLHTSIEKLKLVAFNPISILLIYVGYLLHGGPRRSKENAITLVEIIWIMLI